MPHYRAFRGYIYLTSDLMTNCFGCIICLSNVSIVYRSAVRYAGSSGNSHGYTRRIFSALCSFTWVNSYPVPFGSRSGHCARRRATPYLTVAALARWWEPKASGGCACEESPTLSTIAHCIALLKLSPPCSLSTESTSV